MSGILGRLSGEAALSLLESISENYTESSDESDTDETEISLEPEFTATQIIVDTSSFGEQLRDITNYPIASASSYSCQLDESVNDPSYYPENDTSVSNDESGNSEDEDGQDRTLRNSSQVQPNTTLNKNEATKESDCQKENGTSNNNKGSTNH